MAKPKPSKKWMEDHLNDPYVKKAQVDGYRSRASYKLIEINEKDQLVRPGNIVMDLGSAPGGWSQVLAPMVGDAGRVIASDILPMDSIVGVSFLQGDFTDEAVYNAILKELGDDRVDRASRGAGGEIQLTDAIAKEINGDEGVYGYRFNGQRYDCGSKAGFLQATVAFGLSRDDLRDDLEAYLHEVVSARKAAQ